MTVESATYIHQLSATLPLATDVKSQGDDHIRLIKSAILATFPNINAAVSASDEELNYLVGLTSSAQTQLDAKIDKTGETGMTGSFSFASATVAFGTLTAVSATISGVATVPTLASGDNSQNAASTAFVAQAILGLSLPGQTGRGGLGIGTDGTTADWRVTGAEALALMALGIW